MIVFVEGVDGSGKTTLVKQLQERGYRTEYCYREDTHFSILNEMKKSDKVYILDRGPITDIVYRLTDDLPRDEMTLLEIATLLEGSKIIYCSQPLAYEYATARGEDNIKSKIAHDKLTVCYEYVMSIIARFCNTKIILYNWHMHDITNIIKFIEEEQ